MKSKAISITLIICIACVAIQAIIWMGITGASWAQAHAKPPGAGCA